MQEIKTQIVIPAPRSAVWRAFHTAALWEESKAFRPVDPNVTFEQDQIIPLRVHFPRTPPSLVDATIIVADPEKEIRWANKLPLFRGEHSFQFVDTPEGHTLLIHCDKFWGAFGHVFGFVLRKIIRRSYEEFNQLLSRHAIAMISAS